MKKVTKNNEPNKKPVGKVKTREYTDSAEYSQAKKAYGDSLNNYNKNEANWKGWQPVTPRNAQQLNTTYKPNKVYKKRDNTNLPGYDVVYKDVVKKPVELPTYKPVKKEQVKPVPQKPEAKNPEVKKPSGETKLKQGREFMKETGLRPGYYSDSQVQEAINKKIPIKRR